MNRHGFSSGIGLAGCAFLVLACAPPKTETDPARELVMRSIAFHDPGGVWGERAVELTWLSTETDGRERALLKMTFSPDGKSFEMSGHYKEIPFEYAVQGDEVSARVRGEGDLDEATREQVYLHREDGLMWRNYFRFLAGLPMNLQDPGVHLEGPEPAELSGRTVQAVTVTYDPAVGTETWTFYFDPDTAQLLGCRFEKADPSKPGEYFLLDDLIESGGLRLPRRRSWYMSEDDRYIGDEIIQQLRVAG